MDLHEPTNKMCTKAASDAGVILALDRKHTNFHAPCDLLLTPAKKEKLDAIKNDLAEIALDYVEHLEGAWELDRETTTEILVLIDALLELKSPLILPRDEEEEID